MGLYEQTEQYNSKASLIHINFSGNDMGARVQNINELQMVVSIMFLVDKMIEADEEAAIELASMVAARAIIGGSNEN